MYATIRNPTFFAEEEKMVVQLRPRTIIVDRGSRGFGLSLIYRGLDKYEEKDTGIFVARVVPGGQAARCGVRENDKIVTINGKTPRNVDDAVGVIKQAGNQIKVVVLREEDVPDIHVQDQDQSIGERDPTWVRNAPLPLDRILCRRNWFKWLESGISFQLQNTLGQQPISRSGSARSFNTTFGRPQVATPSPLPQRAQFNQSLPPAQPVMRAPSPSPQSRQQQQFLREQAEYKARQAEAERIQQQQLAAQAAQQAALRQQQEQQQPHSMSVKDTVRDIIANTDFSSFDPNAIAARERRVIQVCILPEARAVRSTHQNSTKSHRK